MITLNSLNEDSLSPEYHNPNLIKHLSQAKKKVWQALKSHYEDIKQARDGEFRIDLTELGADLGYSRTAIYWALRTLESGNLIEKVREVKGRGNHSVYRLLWVFDPENETPSRITTLFDSPPRCIAKDSPTYRYFAAEFRRICEKSEQLAERQGGVVGKLLDILSGQEQRIWDKAKIFFGQKINDGLDLQGFFVWLEQYLKPEIAQEREKEQQLRAVREAKESKQQELANRDSEPPRLKDFDKMETYQKAYENWLDSEN